MREVCYLNSNDGTGILGYGVSEKLVAGKENQLENIQAFLNRNKDNYVFACLSYDLKNEMEDLKSENTDDMAFPNYILWVPRYVVQLQKENFIFLQGEKTAEIFDFLNEFIEEETNVNFHHFDIEFKARTSKEKYIQRVNGLKDSIQKGDVYEVNYCQEFYAENVEIPFPLDTYFKLNNITRAPFSGFVDLDDYLIFCGSPERYIQQESKTLLSQPIKGTAPRGENPSQDEDLKKDLAQDVKERAENIMIVDLVRNDFSKIAEKGTVRVDELCEIYSFETVHQMISTISCEPRKEVNFTDILKATFPMGSMTGAPKISAMNLIEEAEDFKRGIYSGSIGYFSPNGNFDFNVVIRSLVYNKRKKYLSCAVGSAITILSDAEKEYEECLVKVKKILDGMHAF